MKVSIIFLWVCLRKDSTNLQIYYQRSMVYSAMKQYEKAIADIKKYLLYYPDDEDALKRYAEIAFTGKNYLTAIRVYTKLIEKYSEKFEYLKLRANVYMKTTTYNYAIKDYSMALDLYPNNSEIYYQKGIAHFKLNQRDKACAAWKNAQRFGSNKCDDLIYKYCRSF